MLFNSLQFAAFFTIVYLLYLALNHKWQNRMLLVASCIFYGAWSYKFLLLMFVSITTDYFCGKYIYLSANNKIRKRLLVISIAVNFIILGVFKYFNFFAENFQSFLGLFGLSVKLKLLHIILPVGISFYTFQAVSYAFDIYRRSLVPARNYLNYALFVTYFPQLVAGPIMRAKDLLPQIINPRKVSLDKFYEGCYLIFWGLFQKVFIADNLARLVDPLFAASPPYNGIKILLALYAFSFQIFCDFAGYSNMARGLGKCMGFDIMINFNVPYFSTNPQEFWKRWHISLSSWWRDYLYIPLGGNKKGSLVTYRNLVITMILGGLWHGAKWTFVLWGIYHAILLIIYKIIKPFLNKLNIFKDNFIKKIWFFVKVVFFFHLICFGWLIFRAQSFTQAIDMLRALFFDFCFIRGMGLRIWSSVLLIHVWFLLILQYFYYKNNRLDIVLEWPVWKRALIYVYIFYCLVSYGAKSGQEFIYFQF